MTHFWIVMMSFSIAPAAVICLARYRFTLNMYRPFIYLTALSLLSEVISLISSYYKGNNIFNSNCYVLAEWLLVVWLMSNWAEARKTKFICLSIGVLVFIAWILETLILRSSNQFNSVFRICYSVATVCMAITPLNRLIVRQSDRLLTNARFLICCAFIIYFTYKALLETVYLFHFTNSVKFEWVIFESLAVLNVICNIIYTLASLCIPTKRRLTLPYS